MNYYYSRFYNRFLARIWDKEEKRMLYPDIISYGKSSQKETKLNNKRKYKFIGISGAYILFFSNDGCLFPLLNKYHKHRFIPMKGLGKEDKNRELIYEADILKITDAVGTEYFIVKYLEDSSAFGYVSVKDSDYVLVANPSLKGIEIIGNIYEHPHQLEQKEN